ncbi:hypothetical protein DKM19_25150 [Streptosporangium sp. 'caverna']|nr:hypothetical protein DKM19_25150 [Streptosporangium sp. 'caverna']
MFGLSRADGRRIGEALGGQCFWCSDLIIIRDAGFEGMAAAIRDLVSSRFIEGACGLLDPLDDEEVDMQRGIG